AALSVASAGVPTAERRRLQALSTHSGRRTRNISRRPVSESDDAERPRTRRTAGCGANTSRCPPVGARGIMSNETVAYPLGTAERIGVVYDVDDAAGTLVVA